MSNSPQLSLALRYHQAGRLDEAEEMYRAVLDARPGHAGALHLWGVLAHQRGQNGEAAQRITLSLSLTPEQPQAWNNLGNALLALERGQAAVECYRRAVLLDPQAGPAQANLGNALLALRQRAAAAAALGRATVLDPHSVLAWTVLGDSLNEARHPAEALAAYGRALALDPLQPAALTEAGNAALALGRLPQALHLYRRALVARPDSPQALSNLAKACFAGGDTVRALTLFQRLLQLTPGDSEAKTWLSGLYHQHGHFDLAAAMAQPPQFQPARRSVVVPVLDYSPGAPWNIRTLLDDLAGFDGEVAVVFNSPQVCEDLKDHPRIDKFCVNKHNVGVARGWNMGLNLAEGAVVFVLNADLHVTLEALERIEAYVLSLPDAVLVGVGGDIMEPVNFHALRSWLPGAFSEPVEVDRVSGYLFAIHAERFHDAGLSFDPRLSPYFHEETDIAFKIKAAGLKAYAVPVTGFGHEWGITASDRPISYFGRPVKRNDMLIRNGLLLRQKLRKKKEKISPQG